MRKWTTKQVWYNLKSKDGSIDMLFSRLDVMLNYWRHMNMDDALKCSWNIVEI